MKRQRVTSVAIAIAAMAGGALAVAGDKPAPAKPAAATAQPSPLIYPAETIPLKFDHAQHARLGATCEGCHVTAQTSTSAADNLIPREAACRACHKIDRAQPEKAVAKGQGAARCDACHADHEMGTLGGAASPPREGSRRAKPVDAHASGDGVDAGGGRGRGRRAGALG